MKDGICSENFSRYGLEYSEKILKFLNVDFSYSRIDGNVVFFIKKNDYMLDCFLHMFFNLQKGHYLVDDLLWNEPNYLSMLTEHDDEYLYKIEDFSTDEFKNYIKIIRKRKLKFIEECQKYS